MKRHRAAGILMAKWALHPGEPLHQGLVRVVDALVARALAGLADAVESPTGPPRPQGAGQTALRDAVHRVRVAIKRLRAIWRLVGPALASDVARRQNQRLRDAARLLTAARERFVLRQTLADVVRRTPKAQRWALRAAQARLEERLPAAPRHLTAATVSKVRQALLATRRAMRGLRGLPAAGRDWRVLALGLRRSYRRARRAMAAADEHAGGYHEWRKRVKDLGYQLELLAAASPARLGRLHEELRALARQLGQEHDLLMLTAQVRRHAGALGQGQAQRLSDLIQDRLRRRRRACRQRGRRLLRARAREAVPAGNS